MLVLCNGGDAFDSFRRGKAGAEPTQTTSLLLHENEKTAIVVDVVREKSDSRLSAVSAPADLPGPDAEVASSGGFMTENDPYREFYLQYFRLTIRRGAGTVAPWLEEGLVQLLASINFSKDYIAIGRLRDGAGGRRADEFNVQLDRRPLLPLEQMFVRERPGSAAAPGYSAQCYAFVHLRLYGKKARHQSALLKLVERAASAPVTEPVVRACFGLSYELMAEVWAISARAPSPEEPAVVYDGAQRFPRRLRLLYLAAALALQHGTADAARALIAHGLLVGGDSEVSQHFKALQAQLPK